VGLPAAIFIALARSTWPREPTLPVLETVTVAEYFVPKPPVALSPKPTAMQLVPLAGRGPVLIGNGRTS
jgi:hypothetical protein